MLAEGRPSLSGVTAGDDIVYFSPCCPRGSQRPWMFPINIKFENIKSFIPDQHCPWPTRGSIFANTKLPQLPKYLVLWVMTRLCKARMVWSPAFSQPTWWELSLNSFSKGPLPWSGLWYLISWLGSTHWSRSWSFVNTLTVFSEHWSLIFNHVQLFTL